MTSSNARVVTVLLLGFALLLAAAFAPAVVARLDQPSADASASVDGPSDGITLLDPDEDDDEEDEEGDDEREDEEDDEEKDEDEREGDGDDGGDSDVSVAQDDGQTTSTPSTTATTTTSTTTATTTTTTTTRTTTTTTTTEPGEVEVEFLNCSAVRISGDVPEVRIGAFTYVPGVDTYITTVGPYEGARVVDADAIWDSPRGVVIDHVRTVGDGEPQIDEENPNLEECRAEIRPDRPTASVASTERTGNGTIEVTFEYENPNDVPLENFGGGLDGRVVAGDAPDTLRPGEHAFTVTWEPVNESSRLTWTVELGAYGYSDDPLVVRTETAGSIEGDEPTTTTTTRTTTTTTDPPPTTATTTATTTPPSTTSASSGGGSSDGSSSGGSSDGSASTTTRTTTATPTTTETPSPSTPSSTATTAEPTTVTTTATSTVTASNGSATETASDPSADASTPRGGGSFARVDSSDVIQGGSIAVAATFGALAFVAWRRQHP